MRTILRTAALLLLLLAFSSCGQRTERRRPADLNKRLTNEL